MRISVPDGFDFRFVEEIESTSDALKTAAEQGAPDSTVLAAGRQTAGRGRYGRTWASPYGNVYLSLLLRDLGPPAKAAEMSFVTAVALGEALSALTPGEVAFRFKWPNDVLIDGQKVAGILLESGGEAERPWIVVGIGVNLRSHPLETTYPATNLAGEGIELRKEEVIEAFLPVFAEWRKRWETHGFAPVRAAWSGAATGKGEPVRLRISGRAEQSGRFVDIDSDGALLFLADGAKESERITAGEVYFPETVRRS